jgi:hypothetical protein
LLSKYYRYPATPSDDDSGKLVTEIPISVALTEFHFVLLYKDRVRAICQLNDQIVYEEMIPIVSFFLEFALFLMTQFYLGPR